MITTKKQWLEEYRKDRDRVWIIVEFKSKSFYFTEYDQWYEVQEKVKDLGPIQNISLQFRSHVVHNNVGEKCDGAYIVRSLLGRVGGEVTETITVGTLVDGLVYKTVWSTPDLSVRDTSKDELSRCFEKALVRWQ